MILQSELAHHARFTHTDLLTCRVHGLPSTLVPDPELAARTGEDHLLEQAGVVAQGRRNEQPTLLVDRTFLRTGEIEVVVELHRRGREVDACGDARLELDPLRVRTRLQAADVADAQVGEEQTIVSELGEHVPELHRYAHPS